MIGKIFGRVAAVVKNNAETSGKKVAGGIKQEFARSPKADCFVAESFNSTNPFKSVKAQIAGEEASQDYRINFFLDELSKQEKFKKVSKILKKAAAQKKSNDTDRFGLKEITEFLTLMRGGHFKKFEKLIDAKNAEGGFRFNSGELIKLSWLKGKKFENAQKLLKINTLKGDWIEKLSSKNIDSKKIDILISSKSKLNNKLMFEYEAMESALTAGGIDLEKLMPRLEEKLLKHQDDLAGITLIKPHPTKGEFGVRYVYTDGHVSESLFDASGKKINYTKGDFKFNEKGEAVHTYKVYDTRNNTYAIVQDVRMGNRFVVRGETRIIKDANGKVVRKEVLTPSDVKGIYNIKSVDAKGNVTILSSGVRDEKGCVTIKKNFESTDGTKTHYEYYDDPEGNRITYYKITDKKGKMLLNDTQSFEVVDSNTVISSHGNKSYEIKREENGMKIRNLQSNETTAIDFDTFLVEDNRSLKMLLSNVNAEELITLHKKGMKLEFDLDGSAVTSSGIVHVGERLSSLEHEIGHVKDISHFNVRGFRKDRIIAGRPQLSRVYNKERKAFLEKFPTLQEKYVDYFISQSLKYPPRSGIQETIAESNGILNSYQSSDALAIRTTYLQQYFPRTIAKAAELMGLKRNN